MAGKGLAFLRAHGVEVEIGVLQAECDALNDVFFHYIRTKRPYVVMKYAMTLDGKIATRTGASRWITGEEARQQVHRDRHRYAAIMAGVGTVLTDDPLLTCRMEGGRNPVRVICDTHLRTPLEQLVLETDCPYMAPEPVRGTRCDSSLIRYVGEYIAQVKGVSTEEVFRQTAENARRVYHL